MDLICLGELLIDMFPAELGPFARGGVGVPAGAGRRAGERGGGGAAAGRGRAAFIGKVGDDPFGHYLVDVLAHEGVETRGCGSTRRRAPR